MVKQSAVLYRNDEVGFGYKNNIPLRHYFTDRQRVLSSASLAKKDPSYIPNPNLDDIIEIYDGGIVASDVFPRGIGRMMARRLYERAVDFDKAALKYYVLKKKGGELPRQEWSMEDTLGSNLIHRITNNQNVLLDFGMDTGALIAICSLSGACRVNGRLIPPEEIKKSVARRLLGYENFSHSILVPFDSIDQYNALVKERDNRVDEMSLPFTLFRSYPHAMQKEVFPKLIEQLQD